MCGEEGTRDLGPKEKRLKKLELAVEREGLTVKDLEAICEPGVLSEIVARLNGANAHEKS